jgi:hypothetical protein
MNAQVSQYQVCHCLDTGLHLVVAKPKWGLTDVVPVVQAHILEYGVFNIQLPQTIRRDRERCDGAWPVLRGFVIFAQSLLYSATSLVMVGSHCFIADLV